MKLNTFLKKYCGIAMLCLFLQQISFAQPSSSFVLSFEDVTLHNSKGFDDPALATVSSSHPLKLPPYSIANPTMGQLRQWTAGKVFEYINTVIEIGNAHPNILFKASNDPSMGTTTLGSARATYTAAAMLPGQFVGGNLYDHIYNGVPNPGASVDAEITLNFIGTFNNDALIPSVNQYDLFSIILHETAHALGFASLIAINGKSTLSGSASGPFSRYDKLLYYSGTPLINPTTYTSGSTSFLISNQVQSLPVFRSKDHPIFSPGSFKDGSSLSHIDVEKGGITLMNYLAVANDYRAFRFDELEILCGIGYTIKGDKMSPNPGPWGCSVDHSPIAIDDLLTSSGASECFNIIVNDYDTDPGDQFIIDPSFGIDGFLVLNGGNVKAFNTNNQLCVVRDPNFCGTIRIQYRLVDKNTGRKSNIATVSINQTSGGGICDYNPEDPCNYVLNGSFEQGLDLSVFDSRSAFDDMNAAIPTNVDHWFGYSTDLFIKGSIKINGPTSLPVQGIPLSFFNGSTVVDVRPGSLSNNKRYVGAYANNLEFIATRLAVPVSGLPVGNYIFETWLYSPSTTSSPGLNVFISKKNAGMPNISDPDVRKLTSIPLAGTVGSWKKLTMSFAITAADAGRVYLYLVPTGPGGKYHFMDEVKIIKAGPRYMVAVTTSTPYPTPTSIISYMLKVCNEGSADNTPVEVKLTSTLPTGVVVYPIQGFGSGATTYTVPGGPFAAGECRTVIFSATVTGAVTQCQPFCLNFDIKPGRDIMCNRSYGCATIVPQGPCGCNVSTSSRSVVTIERGTSVNLGTYDNECNSSLFPTDFGWEDVTHGAVYATSWMPVVAPTDPSTLYRRIREGASGCRCTTEVVVNTIVKNIEKFKTYELTNPCGGMFIASDCIGAQYTWTTPAGTFTGPESQIFVSPEVTNYYSVTTILPNGATCKTKITVNVPSSPPPVNYYNKLLFNPASVSPASTGDHLTAISVKKLPAGGSILLADYVQDPINSGRNCPSRQGYALIRLDEKGAILWIKRYALYLTKVVPVDFVVTDDGYTLLLRSFNPNNTDYYIVHHTDFSGNTIWERAHQRLHGTYYPRTAKPIKIQLSYDQQSVHDGYVIGGMAEYGAFVSKLNLSGVKLWDKVLTNVLGASNYDWEVADIAISRNLSNQPDGYVLLINRERHAGLIKLSLNGAVLSPYQSIYYALHNEKFIYGKAVLLTYDSQNLPDGYLITGFEEQAAGGRKLFLVKHNLSLTPVWGKTYTDPDALNLDNAGYDVLSIESATETGFVIAGIRNYKDGYSTVPGIDCGLFLLFTDRNGTLTRTQGYNEPTTNGYQYTSNGSIPKWYNYSTWILNYEIMKVRDFDYSNTSGYLLAYPGIGDHDKFPLHVLKTDIKGQNECTYNLSMQVDNMYINPFSLPLYDLIYFFEDHISRDFAIPNPVVSSFGLGMGCCNAGTFIPPDYTVPGGDVFPDIPVLPTDPADWPLPDGGSGGSGGGGMLTGDKNVVYDSPVSKKIIAFPNPFNDHLTITLQGEDVMIKKITIVNILGKVLYNAATDLVKEITLPVSLENGTYLIYVEDTQETSHVIKMVSLK
jgi:hypothetical protein